MIDHTPLPTIQHTHPLRDQVKCNGNPSRHIKNQLTSPQHIVTAFSQVLLIWILVTHASSSEPLVGLNKDEEYIQAIHEANKYSKKDLLGVQDRGSMHWQTL